MLKNILKIIGITVLVAIIAGNLLLFTGGSMEAQYVFYNASIPGENKVKTIVIQNNKVHFIGTKEDAYKFIGSDSKVIDLENKFIIESFKDAHIHLGAYGKYNAYPELSNHLTLDGLKENNGWIIVTGLTNELKKDYPDNSKLNEKFPNIKVCLIHESFHGMLCNQNALKAAKIDSKDGFITESNSFGMMKNFPEDTIEDYKGYILKAQELMLKQNVYEVDNVDVPETEYLAIKELEKAGKLSIKINNFLKPIPAKKFKTHIKIFLDGALGSETAAMIENYKSGKNGKILISETELLEYMDYANTNKVTLAVHVIGDKAYKFLCETVLKFGKTLNIRVEHAQHIKEVINKSFTYSIQPLHYYTDSVWFKNKLNSSQQLGSYRWNSLVSKHLNVVAGSDAPIANTDILTSIKTSISRKNISGETHNPEEALTPSDAIYIHSTPIKIGSPRFFILNKDGTLNFDHEK